MPLDQIQEGEEVSRQRAEMSFFDHIIELRKHILRAALSIGVVGSIFFFNKQFVFDTLIFGPKNADFPTYRFMCWASQKMGAGEAGCFKPPVFKLITRDLGEVVMQHLSVSFWLGIVGAFPYIFWQFWQFISPGLHEHERKAVRGIVFICSSLFILGVAFGYYVIAPLSISFLAGYTLDGLEVSPTLSSYVTYMTMFTIPIGLIFEMPVIAYFLSSVGLVGAKFLRSYRRHAVVVILIIAAIITPPDVVSQILISIPLYLLYEASIVVVIRVQARREKALAASDNRSYKPLPETTDEH